jgi:ribosomal-protein-serine acetyltransferase
VAAARLGTKAALQRGRAPWHARRVSPIVVDRTHPPSRLVYRDGERFLELRPLGFGDVDALVRAVEESLPELRPFMPWAHLPVTRQGEYELVARLQADYHAGRDYVLGMFSEAGELLGTAGLHPRVPLNPRGLEVGYWCRSGHVGRGHVTLAGRMLAVLAFDRFGCDRLQVSHDEANVASRRVVEKCGFTYEGTARNLLAEVSDEVRAGGYRGTRRNRRYAMTPEDLPGLDWLAGVRARMVVYDALGGVSPGA